jgi:hypothetical protein
MASKDASQVAKRCLCLELLIQRVGLEVDDEDSPEARDGIRHAWVSRIPDLGLSEAFLAEERAVLERTVGDLDEDEVDELQGQASAALVLLWALGRLTDPPTVDSVIELPDLIAEHGVLGDGSISGAKTAIANAKLRPDAELRAQLALYAAQQGDPKGDRALEPAEVVAVLAVHALSWVVDRYMKYEGGQIVAV